MALHHFCEISEFLTVETYEPITKQVNKAAAIYLSNLYRIQSLARFPTIALGTAMVTQFFDSMARDYFGITTNDPRVSDDHALYDPLLSEAKDSLRKKFQKDWFEKSQRQETRSGMDVGHDYLSRILNVGEKETTEGMDAVLKGVVTGTWTAFEVLTEMIWESVASVNPAIVAGIPIGRHHKGRKTGFRSVDATRYTYELTFKHNAGSIITVMDDPKIAALAAVRHLIVHRNAIVDLDFEKHQKNLTGVSCFAPFLSTSINRPIPFTGQIVSNLITPTIALGFTLVKEVDSWLLSNS